MALKIVGHVDLKPELRKQCINCGASVTEFHSDFDLGDKVLCTSEKCTSERNKYVRYLKGNNKVVVSIVSLLLLFSLMSCSPSVVIVNKSYNSIFRTDSGYYLTQFDSSVTFIKSK